MINETYCPLALSTGNNSFMPCGEACEWYMRNEKTCAMVILARDLNKLCHEGIDTYEQND